MADSEGSTFEPPGSGTWHLFDGHFPAPLTRYFREIYPETMPTATNRAHAEYGVLLDLDVELVNGFWYTRARPYVPDPPHADQRPESRAELEAEFERRTDRMAETFETKRWRSDLERWDGEWKPDHSDTVLALQRVDLASLDDDELLAHVKDCRDAALRGAEIHHRMSECWGLPVGDFLAHAHEWTDRSHDDLVGLLDGASPASRGPVEELDAVATVIDGDDVAREVLYADAAPDEILRILRRHSDAVGGALDDWIAVAGHRLASGYDLSAATARERPAVLVRALRSALDDGSGATDHDHEEALAAVRAEVPDRHRETFDELFAEARAVHRIKDEREIDLWTIGVLRRALLEAGRRLADRSRLHDPEHVVDLSHDELPGLVRDGTGPSADAVADRVAYRRSHDSDDAPDLLGPAPTDPFEGVDLPEPSARARRGAQAMGSGEIPDPDDDGEAEAVVRGHAASPGTHEGPARVVTGPDDLGRIEEGDVLVTGMTSTAFNVVLPLLGAVVTDSGGMLSHPAIVAREFGVPGVVGCEDATARIQDGDRLVVDGDEGTVRRVSVPTDRPDRRR